MREPRRFTWAGFAVAGAAAAVVLLTGCDDSGPTPPAQPTKTITQTVTPPPVTVTETVTVQPPPPGG